MDTVKNYLRAFWPQLLPAAVGAASTVWLLWGLHPVTLATISLVVGVGIFFSLVFIALAFDW